MTCIAAEAWLVTQLTVLLLLVSEVQTNMRLSHGIAVGLGHCCCDCHFQHIADSTTSLQLVMKLVMLYPEHVTG